MNGNVEKSKATKGDGTGLHLVMNNGSGFTVTRAGADVLDGWAKQGDVIQPGSAVAAKLIQIADTSKGLKLNKELRRLHEKTGGNPLGSIEGATPKQLPSGTLEDQMSAQLGGFVSRGQAAQKAVDAQLLAAKPFPEAKGVELIDIEQLVESTKNPRQDFDEADIEGLAKSIIKTNGLMVPILVRPFPSTVGEVPLYEIADGARRFRALQLLKKQKHELGEKALVDIRPLTDAQLAEAFMTADRRKTLNPMEQARGFKNMIDTGHTFETIASTLGVSKGTVIGRLKLLELSPKAVKLFASGLLTTAIATPLGRYPHALQDEALEQMLDKKHHEGSGGGDLNRHVERHNWSSPLILNVGACIAWLQEHFTKSLKTTPWDQDDTSLPVPAELWPEFTGVDGEVPAPACKACPKNSNNMHPDVAGENAHGRSSAGFCTLPPCFEEKWLEALKRMRAEAKERGEKVLGATASKSALKKITNSDSRYAKASEVNHADPKKRTWGQLLELANKNIDDSEQIREVIAISEEQGKARLIEKGEVEKVLAAQKVLPKPKKKPAAKNYYEEHQRDYALQQEKSQAREEIARDVIVRYAKHVREKGPTLPMLRLLIELSGDTGEMAVQLETLFEVKSQRELDTFLEKKATANDLVAALYVCMSVGEIRAWNGFSEEVERAAKELKIDLKKREKDAIAAAKAAEKAKAGETETTEEGDE